MDLFLKDLEELSDKDNMNMMDPIRMEEHEEDDDFVEYNALDRRLNDFIQRIEDASSSDGDSAILECNSLLFDTDYQIGIIDNMIRNNYSLKFPELDSLVPDPIDYAPVVEKIRDETDMVDLQGLLPPSIIIAVSVITAATSGTGKPPLPELVLHRIIDGCDRVVRLNEAKRKILDFIESRMPDMAPNLSRIVGCGVAAKLMGAVGGLPLLAGMPACNVQLLGAKRKSSSTLAGFSSATILRVGYLEETEICQMTPPSLRPRASRLLAAKSVLATRVDSMRGDPMGKTGEFMREDILKKIEKWQEAPPAKLPKPLPVPDSQKRKKRGGFRLRKTKEKYGMTEMRKLSNRMAFGVAEDSSLGDGYGQGYGMLGKLHRLPVAELGAKVASKFKRKLQRYGGATTSSLAFTNLNGIQLSIPSSVPLETGTQSVYFS